MTLEKRLFAEVLGSVLLAATVIGSGIMAGRLAGGNDAIALLGNTGATVAMLAVLIATLAPISGAHFNPAVSLIRAVRGELTRADAAAYVAAQLVGSCIGAVLAHAMFEMPLIQTATHLRAGPAQWLSEVVATCGLLLVALTCTSTTQTTRRVPAWIGAAYWFTASTSFANPAITVARSLTDTFSGIRPSDVPMFIAAQLAGAFLGLGCARFLVFDQQVRQT